MTLVHTLWGIWTIGALCGVADTIRVALRWRRERR
jgi:hypothetical protein